MGKDRILGMYISFGRGVRVLKIIAIEMKCRFSTLFLLVLIFFSCSKKPFDKLTAKEEAAKIIWKQDYKIVTFKKCLKYGLNNNSEIIHIIKLDRSTHQDFAYGVENYKFIDTLVMPIIANAKKDSAEYFDTHLYNFHPIEQKDLNGIPILKHCLEFYESDELDSVATVKINEMPILWMNLTRFQEYSKDKLRAK